MKIYVVRLNPDSRDCLKYSKYPSASEYQKIHSESPMDGFHEAVNFLPENGVIRGYLPPKHAASLRDGEPFFLVTITAKTARKGGDLIVGMQAGCVYSGETKRLNLLPQSNAPDLLCHYTCDEKLSLLFSSPFSNARNTVLGDDIKWVRGPVKELNSNAINRIFEHVDISKLKENEIRKLTLLREVFDGNVSVLDSIVNDASSFLNEVIKSYKSDKKPKGNPKPELSISYSYQYSRDPAVVAFALKRAGGICEICKKDAPFISASTGIPFLEVHHVIPLKDGGSDTVENVKAVCPNCHREAHYGVQVAQADADRH